MKTAIYGPSGAGKTTIAKSMLTEDCIVIHVDDEIRCLDNVQDNRLFTFREQIGIEVFSDSGYFFGDNKTNICTIKRVNNDRWSNYMLYTPSIRTRFEDMLFFDVFLPRIKNINCESFVVDGLLPRFVKWYPFDQIIYVNAPEHIRRKNLLSRGVKPSRINEIISLQSKMDWSI